MNKGTGMTKQLYGPFGTVVDRMIRRSVAKRFHTVYWRPPEYPFPRPFVAVANHSGWFDGYLMYHAMTELRAPFLMWIQEFKAFPLFGKAGGMPFDPHNTQERASTIRRSIRMMRSDGRGLVLFPEGELHYPGVNMAFGASLEFVARKVGSCPVIPIAISYEHAMHERPEAFITFGDPLEYSASICEGARIAVANLLVENNWRIRTELGSFKILARGTKDVNERWDVRQSPFSR